MARLSDSERMIADSAQAFLARAGGTARARAFAGGLDRAIWREMAELGWLALLVPEYAGGLGMTARDAVVVMEACGGAIAPEPLSGAMGAADALALAGNPAADTLAGLLAGERAVLPVAAGGIRVEGGRWSGVSGHVRDLLMADAYLVQGLSADGPVVALLPPTTDGLRREVHETVDGSATGRLVLDGVEEGAFESPPVHGDIAARMGRQAREVAALCDAAMLLGIGEAAFELALEHLKSRHQFGRPLGAFQALQHRAADVHVALAGARAFVYEAALAEGTDRQGFAWRNARDHAAEVADFACREAIQFLGGIGFAEEHDAGLYFKKGMAVAASAATQAPGLHGDGTAVPSREPVAAEG